MAVCVDRIFRWMVATPQEIKGFTAEKNGKTNVPTVGYVRFTLHNFQ